MRIRLRLARFLRRRRNIRRRGLDLLPVGAIEALETRALLSGNSLDSIPQLNSRLGAPVQIYLDFDGHTEVSDWNNGNPVDTPVYDIDGDETTFSNEELSRVEQIWNLVAEDFSPFDVNVTTVDPGSYNNFEALLVSIGGDGAWQSSGGGIAYVNTFSNSHSNTVFVFSETQANGNASFTAFTVSHEVGHAFGLNHHSLFDKNGNKTDEYDPGDNRQGPLLGSAFNSERNTWTVGPSNITSSVIQDDLQVLTRAVNQTFVYRTDDYGNDQSSATTVSFADSAFEIAGVIEQDDDLDFFSIQPTEGTLNLTVGGLDLRPEFGGGVIGTNTDLVLRLYDTAGNLLEESNPTDSLTATITREVDEAQYFVVVTTTGEYGAIGQFALSGTLTRRMTPVMTTPTGTIDTRTPVYEWQASTGSTTYALHVESIANGQTVLDASNISGTSFTSDDPLPQGVYRVRVKGQNTDWSDDLEFTIDVPTPAQPVVSSPGQNQTLEDPLVTFDWANVDFATTYEVLLRNRRTNELTTLTSAAQTSEFTTTDPLADDPYRVWVRAANEAGELGDWGEFVDFVVDLPAAARPTVTAPIGTVGSPNQTITWDAVAGATRYVLWVNGPGRSKLIYQANLTTASYVVPDPLGQGSYRIWVKAFNQNGESEGWSSGASFTIDVPTPDPPMVVAPATVSQTNQPTIEWTQTDDAVAWELWVNYSTGNVAKVVHLPRIESRQFTPTILLADGDYHVWVRAINVVGEYSRWSSRFEFKIDAPAPAAPQLDVPSSINGVTLDRTPSFEWTASSGALSYEIKVDDLTTGETFIQESGLKTTEFVTIPLQDDHEYVGSVRAISFSGKAGDWSNSVEFTFEPASAPNTPDLLSPSGTIDNRGQSVSKVTFTWVNVTGVERFQLFIRDLGTGVSQVLNIQADAKTGATFEYTMELGAGSFRAWVRGINSSDAASNWSNSVSFSVLN
jgi:hypothetical protein